MRGLEGLLYGGISGMMLPFAGGFVPVLIALYVVARWRTLRAGTDDPQLGLKTAICFFMLLSFHVGLAGLFVFLAGLFSDANLDIIKTAAGLLIPAALVLVPHAIALGKTNHREQPMVGRMFLGVCVILTGILGFVGLVFVFQAYFQGDPGQVGKWALAMALVYNGAWSGLLLALLRRSRTAAA